MAPKRQLPSEDPPPASSDEEEESSGASDDEETEEEEKQEGQESGESESKSESDEEDNKGRQEKPSQPKPSSTPPPPPPQQQQQKSQGGSSSTESESESESEAESESESRRYTVKPIASKPMEKMETPPAKKQKPEPSSTSKQPSAKRKVELEGSKEPKESKRGKKKDVAENGSLQKSGEESKKPMFQRIWGDNDEIALLQGMIDFREKKGMDPFANTGAFHHYVKKLLGQEFTDSQLANKIRVLKKKYNTNEGKGKDGEDRAFSKPHEQKVFELSKKIWGANKNGDAGGTGEQTPMSKTNGTAKRGKTAASSKDVTAPKPKSETSLERPKENGELIPSEHSDRVSMLSCDQMLQISGIGLDQDFMKKGWEMVDESRKEELKERWRKLQLTEMRVLAERATLIRDQTNLVLEAYERTIGK